MLQVWFVLLLLLFLVAVIGGFAERPHEHSEAWGYGSHYGGPDFGIPVGWPAQQAERQQDRSAPESAARKN